MLVALYLSIDHDHSFMIFNQAIIKETFFFLTFLHSCSVETRFDGPIRLFSFCSYISVTEKYLNWFFNGMLISSSRKHSYKCKK